MNNFYINKYTAFHLEIKKNYGNFVSEANGDTWCNLVLDVKNDNFTYNLNTEGITESETEQIRSILKKYLEDNIDSEEDFETLEPYININVVKNFDSYCIELKLNIEIGGCFNGDYYSIFINSKEDVQKLYDAFKIIN